jgi:tRNA(fMet)-specific endonuclease VapC
MIVLDTDHLTVLRYSDHPRCASLVTRLDSAKEPVATTVISWEEQLRGWLAEIGRSRDFSDQVQAYERLQKLVAFVQDWEILPFDARAAAECARFRKQKVRIGTQDLKIAAIAMVSGALLLSANLRDFRKVTGLRVENWLD